jgi:hypothetical protein
LLGLGVGNAKASVSAATATWLVKGELDPAAWPLTLSLASFSSPALRV